MCIQKARLGCGQSHIYLTDMRTLSPVLQNLMLYAVPTMEIEAALLVGLNNGNCDRTAGVSVPALSLDCSRTPFSFHMKHRFVKQSHKEVLETILKSQDTKIWARLICQRLQLSDWM
jgi:hypothetical protein